MNFKLQFIVNGPFTSCDMNVYESVATEWRHWPVKVIIPTSSVFRDSITIGQGLINRIVQSNKLSRYFLNSDKRFSIPD